MMVAISSPELPFLMSTFSPFCLLRYDEVGGCKEALEKLREVRIIIERLSQLECLHRRVIRACCHPPVWPLALSLTT